MFAHETLKVYGKALDIAGTVATFCRSWEQPHAVVEHLHRTVENIVLNIAEGARLRASQAKMRCFDYSLESALECAGCLDLVQIKGLLPRPAVKDEKRRLSEVARMLIGLRQPWQETYVLEVSPLYRACNAPLFCHEQLEVYQVSLELFSWFVSAPCVAEMSHRLWKEVDEAATGIVLNIAGGNGKYSALDPQRFNDMADCAAMKVATYLDLCSQNRLLSREEIEPGKRIARRISRLLAEVIN